MKKVSLVVLMFAFTGVFAQSPLLIKVKQRLLAEHPELKLDNKIVVINVWSVSKVESRERNTQLNKAYATYEFAKLKGGLKGMIGVLINLDDELSQQEIALGKDNVSKAINIVNLQGVELDNINNIIFDDKGNEMAKNIDGDIFKEVNALITR